LLSSRGVKIITHYGKDVLMQEYPDIFDIAAGDKNFIFAAFSLL
jgi:hypothetical protein